MITFAAPAARFYTTRCGDREPLFQDLQFAIGTSYYTSSTDVRRVISTKAHNGRLNSIPFRHSEKKLSYPRMTD